MHVIAQQVSMQKRPPAVCFHKQFNRCMLLRFAAEDLGDDAFHLAAVAAVDQFRAPSRQCIASGDQSRQLSEPSLYEFPLRDRRTIGHAELGPGDHARHHDPHRPGCIRTQGNPAQVEPMIGNRQPVAPVAVSADSLPAHAGC